jgi:Protein of unknown function (DUF1569)
MKNLFEQITVGEIKQRFNQLRPTSTALWGKMDSAQMMAHCSATIEIALGKPSQPRKLLGRLLGALAKRSLLVKGEPMRRNAMTEASCLVTDDRNYKAERLRLFELMDRLWAGGPSGCTKHPHFFFGRLTPLEWATLMYSHLDHHLRQFNY